MLYLSYVTGIKDLNLYPWLKRTYFYVSLLSTYANAVKVLRNKREVYDSVVMKNVLWFVLPLWMSNDGEVGSLFIEF